MKVEVSSLRPISQDTLEQFAAAVEVGLSRFESRLTRAEVHLKNEEPAKGRSMKCQIEVRPAGRDPASVTHEATTLDEAVDGAIGKMERLLASTFSKADDARGSVSASGLPT